MHGAQHVGRGAGGGQASAPYGTRCIKRTSNLTSSLITVGNGVRLRVGARRLGLERGSTYHSTTVPSIWKLRTHAEHA